MPRSKSFSTSSTDSSFSSQAIHESLSQESLVGERGPSAQDDNSDAYFEYVNWALEMGLWDGRPVNAADAAVFFKEVEGRLMQLLALMDPSSHEFKQMVANFAYIGATPEQRAIIDSDIHELGLNRAIQIGGPWHSIKKGWKWCREHKKEILIGAAATAFVVTVTVVTFGTGTAGAAEAAAAAGCALLDSIANGNSGQNIALKSAIPESGPSILALEPIPSASVSDSNVEKGPPIINSILADQIFKSHIQEQPSGWVPPAPPIINNLITPGDRTVLDNGIVMDGKFMSFEEMRGRLRFEELLTSPSKPNTSVLSESPTERPIEKANPTTLEGKSWIRRFLDAVGESVTQG